MRRYLKLYRGIFINCLIREMEFRSHFILNNLISFAWSMVVMLTFFFIYQHVDAVSGWQVQEMLLLTAIYFLVDRIFDSFFEINFNNFIALVNNGDLDGVLLKPVSSQFLVSLRRFSFSMLFSNLTMIGVIIYLSVTYFSPIYWWQVLIFLILLAASVIITYSLWFITMLPIFWWGRVDNLQHLFRPFHQLCQMPIEITGRFKPLLTYIVPLAFVATVPAESLIGRLNYALVFYGVAAAAGLLWLSHRLWQWALGYYTSASS